MVKRQYDQTNVDRYMIEYRMRTPYATPTPMNRFTTNPVSARSTRQHTAHERSHSRHNPTYPSYHSEGRIDKNKNTRKKSSHQEENQFKTNNHYHETTVTTSPKQTSSCCTIL